MTKSTDYDAIVTQREKALSRCTSLADYFVQMRDLSLHQIKADLDLLQPNKEVVVDSLLAQAMLEILKSEGRARCDRLLAEIEGINAVLDLIEPKIHGKTVEDDSKIVKQLLQNCKERQDNTNLQIESLVTIFNYPLTHPQECST